MSILRTTNIKGTLESNNTILIPIGNDLQIAGKLDAVSELNIPTWNNASRPTTNLEIGLIGYNTEELITEVYTGDPELGIDGWAIFEQQPKGKTLADIIGVTPFLHYQAEDLSEYSNATVLNATNPWKNNGSAGSGYDLINDSSGHYSSSCSVTTQNGIKSVNFSGFCGLAFKSAQYYTLAASSTSQNWTVAYVFGGGTSSTGSDSSPSFCGHTQGPSTVIPDRIGGGLFGWYASSSFSNQLTNWYDNDGWVPVGSTSGLSNSTANQWIFRTSSGNARSWVGKNSAPFHNTNLSGGSHGGSTTYGANLIISGMGHARRADSSSYTTTGYVYDAVLFNVALSDSQIQLLRDYYADKYPVGNVAS
jgi:hypothetical protein